MGSEVASSRASSALSSRFSHLIGGRGSRDRRGRLSLAHLVSRLRMAEKAPGLISERSRATQPGPTASCNNTGDSRREINEEYFQDTEVKEI